MKISKKAKILAVMAVSLMATAAVVYAIFSLSISAPVTVASTNTTTTITSPSTVTGTFSDWILLSVRIGVSCSGGVCSGGAVCPLSGGGVSATCPVSNIPIVNTFDQNGNYLGSSNGQEILWAEAYDLNPSSPNTYPTFHATSDTPSVAEVSCDSGIDAACTTTTPSPSVSYSTVWSSGWTEEVTGFYVYAMTTGTATITVSITG